ncbi:MAG TPA: response regulator [Clostridia bacterium]|jgi:putative two-component system response regulator|nr:response regulator [Clostridia bacterium]
MEKVLIVDDIAINRKMLETILMDEYECIMAENGKQAIDSALKHAGSLSLILLDIMMPEYNGYEVLRILKRNRLTKDIPVVLITSLDSEHDESRGLTEGAIDYITKPFNAQIVKIRVHNHVELKRHQDMLQELIDIRTKKIIEMRESLLDAVTSIIEYRSLESGKHVKRIKLYCEAQLAYLLENGLFSHQLDVKNASLIARASTMHDIGKVSIPDCILMKPGKLTPEEFDVMKGHTITGSSFIDSLGNSADEEYMYYARQICRHHHERWDGTGYPDGLGGEKIPLSARIVAVADVYDALVSKRVYKPAFSHETAADIIRAGKGSQFDPLLIEAFNGVSETFQSIALLHND